METPFCGDGGVGALPGSELWGRAVYDLAGQRIGEIDAVTRSSRGPVKAIVRTARRPRRFVFVDLAGARLEEGVVIAGVIASSELLGARLPEEPSGWSRIHNWRWRLGIGRSRVRSLHRRSDSR